MSDENYEPDDDMTEGELAEAMADEMDLDGEPE